jgi:hypothetical protein
MKKITVTVTLEDITKGKAQCGKSHPMDSLYVCPIAQALMRMDYVEVCVGGVDVDIDGQKRIPLPRKAIDFVKKFDDGKPVHPITFELELA